MSTMARVSSMSEYPANVGMDVERESIELAMAEHDKDALLTPNSSSPKPPPRVISITHGDVLHHRAGRARRPVKGPRRSRKTKLVEMDRFMDVTETAHRNTLLLHIARDTRLHVDTGDIDVGEDMICPRRARTVMAMPTRTRCTAGAWRCGMECRAMRRPEAYTAAEASTARAL